MFNPDANITMNPAPQHTGTLDELFGNSPIVSSIHARMTAIAAASQKWPMPERRIRLNEGDRA